LTKNPIKQNARGTMLSVFGTAHLMNTLKLVATLQASLLTFW